MGKKKRNKSAQSSGNTNRKKNIFLDSQPGIVPVFVNKFGNAPKQAARIRSQVTHRKAV